MSSKKRKAPDGRKAGCALAVSEEEKRFLWELLARAEITGPDVERWAGVLGAVEQANGVLVLDAAQRRVVRESLAAVFDGRVAVSGAAAGAAVALRNRLAAAE